MSTWPASTGAAPTKDQYYAWWRNLFSGTGTGTGTGATAKSSNSRLAVAAYGSRAPLCYGRVQVNGTLGAVKVSGSSLLLLVVWGEGEIDAIQGLIANGNESTEAVTYARTDYRGTSNQGIDPWLSAAISGYKDTLRGTQAGRPVSLAYSVIKVTTGQPFPASPRAILKGLKIYDPRTSTTAWSANPALILADMLTRAGQKVDWNGSVPAFNLCDETVSGAKRWTCSLVVDSPSSILDHAERLRAYAHCLVAHGPDGIRLIPDGPVDDEDQIAVTAGQIVQGSLKLSRRPYRDTPTCVRVSYTDTAPPTGQANGPWGQAMASAQLDGAGVTRPWIESGLSLDGIQSYAEAMRAAQQRLYGLAFRNLLAECVIRDEGLRLLPGDVVRITHPIGLDAKPMRVLDVKIESPGRYRVSLEEYDQAVYSDLAPSGPTYPDTSLPNPLAVPVPVNLTSSIEIFQQPNGSYAQADGTYASRLRLNWTADAYPYGRRFEVELYVGSTSGGLAWSAVVDSPYTVTPPVTTGLTYTWRVRILASIGLAGGWASAGLAVPIPDYPPTDIEVMSGVEIGGEVRLSWTASIDTNIWRYEIRWGQPNVAWDDAVLLDRVDSLRYSTREIGEGSWDFLVKPIDSVGQYAQSAARVHLQVTRDSRAFFVGDYNFSLDDANSSNIFAHTDRYGVFRAWSELSTVTVEDVFEDVASSYDEIAVAYAAVDTSLYQSDVWDLGVISTDDRYTGTVAADISGLSALPMPLGGNFTPGPLTVLFQTSLDGTNWDDHEVDGDGNLRFKATLAYLRVRVVCDDLNGLLLTRAPTARLDVFALEEAGIITTNASGATTVTLSRDYGFCKAIILTPSGTSRRSAVYDNVVTGSPTKFDVYLFDAADTQISGEVSYRFQGV